MIGNLPADLVFYVSAAGFLFALVLWPYLWVQYRKAGVSEERTVAAAAPSAIEPIRPISTQAPQSAIAPQPVLSVPKASSSQTLAAVDSAASAPTAAQNSAEAPKKEEPAPATTKSATRAALESMASPSSAAGSTFKDLKTGATTSGSISPAVVYLQNLKNQMDGLKKDVDSIRTQIVEVGQKSADQFNSILKHLEALESQPMRSEEPAAKPAAESQERRRSEKDDLAALANVMPEKITLQPESAERAAPQAAPAPEPAPAQDKTVQLKIEPVPAKEAPPTRVRGPVWPV